MADYKRLVSYIYSYPDGVRDKNVGFAKAEVRGGQFKLSVSLKGVYTDTPELMSVYFMTLQKNEEGLKFHLHKAGNIMVNQGVGQYQDLLYPGNLNKTGYTFEDICGIAVAQESNTYYMMFSLWQDLDFDTKNVVFVNNDKHNDEDKAAQVIETEEITAEEPLEELEEILQNEKEPEQQIQSENEDNVLESENVAFAAEVSSQSVEEEEKVKVLAKPAVELQSAEISQYDKLFSNADFIDAFDDDYYYDCIEVGLEQLKKLPVEDDAIINNSFLVHGFCQFKHILFGKVCENDNNTHYFIGVPGMYCNRERFMASMFGFNNFKKSHRSDYSNPYFGYWYQEI